MEISETKGSILLVNQQPVESDGLFIVGPGINLENADLYHLKKKQLRDIDIKIDISTHSLWGVEYNEWKQQKSLDSIKLLLPKGYVILDHYLLGPGVESPNTILNKRKDIVKWSNSFNNLATIDGQLMRSPLDSKGNTRINLSFSNLENSDFTGIPPRWFKNVRFFKTNLTDSKFKDLDFHHQNKNSRGSTDQNNFEGCEITGVDFGNSLNLYLMKGVVINGTFPTFSDKFRLEEMKSKKNTNIYEFKTN